MSDQAEKIADMALSLIKGDPNKDCPLEFRIAAMKAAVAIMDAEMSRQMMLAAMSNALRR